MLHYTLTSKGQTNIRKALHLKPGDKLIYRLEGNHVTLRPHRGLAALGGMLASDKCKNLSFAEIRKATRAGNARKREAK